jgi:hypothetical protein
MPRFSTPEPLFWAASARQAGSQANLLLMDDFGLIQRPRSKASLAICGLLLCSLTWAQSEDHPVPLGDFARSLRKRGQPAASPTIIDNDNISQIMDEVESQRLTRASLLYSFDATGKTFQVSSPDVTCSLSFNANATSLLSRPYAPIDLPEEELIKLDGPASINDEELQISVFNGTQWKVEEITVGLTVLRHPSETAGYYGPGKLVPASSEAATIAEKHPDVTTLHRLKATAPPSEVTVFKSPLSITLAPGDEWHWAIIQAKGEPPEKFPPPLPPFP